MRRIIICFLLCVLMVASGFVIIPPNVVAPSTTIYVDDDGTADYPTIRDGLAKAKAGDTVFVYAGKYNENVILKNDVDLIGEGANVTTISGTATTSGVVAANGVNNVVFRGFNVTVTTPKPGYGRGLVLKSSNLTIERNVITNVHYGMFLYTNSNATIRNNVFYANYDEQAIYIDGSSPTIKNNILANYYWTGIHVVGSSTPTICFNDVYNCKRNYTGTTKGKGDISDDPKFVDPSTGDFQLQASSPCIDKGDPLDPIPAGGGLRIDMGAFEYISTVGTPLKILRGPLVRDITENSAKIQWVTDKDSDGKVEFSKYTGKFTNSVSDSSLVKSHGITLSGLDPSTIYNFIVKSKDSDNNEVCSDVDYFKTSGAPDTANPTVQLTGPTQTQGFAVFHAQGFDDVEVEKIEFYVNDEYQYTAYTNDYEWVFNPEGLANGDYKIGVKAYDKSGKSSYQESSVKVTLPAPDLSPPNIEIIKPFGMGPKMDNILVEVEMNDPDSGIDRVEYYIDDDYVWTDDINGAPGVDEVSQYVWDTFSVSNGDHTISVKVFNNDPFAYGEDSVDVLIANLEMPKNKEILEIYGLRIKNREVEQLGNAYYKVQFELENYGNKVHNSIVIKDKYYGFQAIQPKFIILPGPYNPHTYTTIVRYNWYHKYSEATFSIGSIDSGETIILTCYMVPILFAPDPRFDFQIGPETIIESDQGTRTVHLPANVMLSGNIHKAISTENILAPLNTCDYLVAVHPYNLFNLYVNAEVDVLLSDLANFARQKNAVLGYLLKNPSADELENAISMNYQIYHIPNTLEYVIVSGGWNYYLRDDWSWNGYMLIVGEIEAIQSYNIIGWNIDWDNDAKTENTNIVPVSDHPYADLNNDGPPDLRVGRLLGNSPAEMRTQIQSSLSYSFDRSEALTMSGVGSDYLTFLDGVNQVTGALTPEFYVKMIHGSSHVVIDYVPINYGMYDGFAVGDLGGLFAIGGSGPVDEILVAEQGTAIVKIYSRTGNHLTDLILDNIFGVGDKILVGNVYGGSANEVIFADKSADTVYIYNCHYTWAGGSFQWSKWLLKSFYYNFESYDQIAIGDVVWDSNDDIIISDPAEDKVRVYYYYNDLLLLTSFYTSVPSNHNLAAGKTLGGTKAEIVLAKATSMGGKSIYIYDIYGNILRIFGTRYHEISFMYVGDFNTYKYETSSVFEEIIIGDINSDTVYFYNGSGDKFSKSPITVSIQNYDKMAIGEIADDDLVEVFIADESMGNAYYFNVYWGSRIRDVVLQNMPNSDVMYFIGHSNVNQICGALNIYQTFDFGNTNPFVLATTCLTGDYTKDNYGSIARHFLKQGAGTFIGSTEVSANWQNHDAGIAFFKSYWFPGRSVGEAFTLFERDVWPASWLWKFWVSEYNIYGDPKFGVAVYGGTRGASSYGTRQFTPSVPASKLVLEIPDYEVTNLYGIDYVTIPGGDLWLEIGDYQLPYYTKTLDFPVGYRVQDVLLKERSGLVTNSGLNLPVNNFVFEYETEDGGIEIIRSTKVPGTEGWFPEKEFDWEIIENTDGTSTLVLMIYPFYYNLGTTDVHFYKNYKFEIDYTESTVEITEANLDDNEYTPGEVVNVDVELYNSGSNTESVLLSAEIESYIAATFYDGLALKALDLQPGGTYVSLSWDTTGFDDGDYMVNLLVKDGLGDVLDTKLVKFRLGISQGEITDFSVEPKVYYIGDTIEFEMKFENTGTAALDGSAVITVSNSTNYVVAEFQHTFSDLDKGEIITISDELITTGLASDTYKVSGYVLYDGKAAIAEPIYIKDVSTLIEDLIDVIEEMGLPKGISNSLISKLENAQKAYEKGNYKATINILEALIKEVKAQSGKKLTEAQAVELIAAAQMIIDTI